MAKRDHSETSEPADTGEESKNPFIYLSGSIAAVWVVVGWANPETNFYLFPIIIAAVMPLAYRLHGERRLSWPAALGAGAAGFINVFIVAMLLRIARRLDGIPIIDGVSLLLEAFVLGLIGALLGAAIAHLVPGGRRPTG